MSNPLRVRHARPVRSAVALAVVSMLGALSPTVLAQPAIELSGLAYIDYSYVLSSFDADEEGYNTFDYRRVYLTTDFTLSDQFDGRVRLEAQGRSTTAQGRPAPFIKDAYLTWREPLGAGSRLRLGVQPPPLFEVAEDTWGYRSLDETIQDRVSANDSRDFGFRTDIALTSNRALRVAAMVSNGNGVRPEPDFETGKHYYGQLQIVPEGPFRATAGLDYNRIGDEDDARTGRLKPSVFVGAVTDAFRAGLEGFYVNTTFDDPMVADEDGFGVSVFGALNFDERTSLVGRYDFVDADGGRVGADEQYALAAFVYRPDPHVELMPNVVLSKLEDVEAEVLGRITVHVRF